MDILIGFIVLLIILIISLLIKVTRLNTLHNSHSNTLNLINSRIAYLHQQIKTTSDVIIPLSGRVDYLYKEIIICKNEYEELKDCTNYLYQDIEMFHNKSSKINNALAEKEKQEKLNTAQRDLIERDNKQKGKDGEQRIIAYLNSTNTLNFDTIIYQLVLSNYKTPDIVLIGRSGVIVIEVKNHKDGIILGDINHQKWLDMRTRSEGSSTVVHTTYVQPNYIDQAKEYSELIHNDIKSSFNYDVPIDYFVLIIDNDQRTNGAGYKKREHLWSMLPEDNRIIYLDPNNDKSLSKKFNSYNSKLLTNEQVKEICDKLTYNNKYENVTHLEK
ncbi:MAG: nuclease-related domain-containing protein [Oscillospiraceae bacterium]